jgi:hypothetical protein
MTSNTESGRNDDTMRVRRGFVPLVRGQDIDVTQSGAVVIAAANDLHIGQGGGSAILAGNGIHIERGGGNVVASGAGISIKQGGAFVAAAPEIKFEKSFVAFAVGRSVEFGAGSRLIIEAKGAGILGLSIVASGLAAALTLRMVGSRSARQQRSRR